MAQADLNNNVKPIKRMRRMEISDKECQDFPAEKILAIRNAASRLKKDDGMEFTVTLGSLPDSEETRTLVWRTA